ncbi:hypothetical protein C499_08692 [Halogeometricum borinquense DSM 11551]|uniref:Uncharacterized protein n=2 Tax=Halogeometricum borinquense TaxID=60847 RepID=E4NMF0_HALBP|nr:hypothetical protein [Halogeometricum borinquense]ADQ68448.1 hypothetical protein Hbor_29090 [Halogeometricum borinquense DSM 11551]ELY27908.1 hypothetical protein C499_08692 [Halogeometricum borinquense DSM 11551]RYJ15019.1 hypothetical protein ELS19_14380 [Halogeometricum borinquense]
MGNARTNGHTKTVENPANGRSTANNDDWQPRTWDRDAATRGMNYGDHPAGDLLSTLSRSGAPPDAAKLWASELNQDHILGKLDEAELWYRRHELDINMDLLLASAPPSESIWQGPRRRVAGLDGKPWPFSPTEIHEARDTRDAAYERNTRSRDGWQQKLLAEQQSERRIVEERDDSSGGLLSKLVG